MAEALVPSNLARLIERGPRALEHAQKALDYLFGQAHDKIGPRGETLVFPAAEVHLHAPRPDNARIACAGGNFADHAAAMAVKFRRRPYEGDAYEEIRKAGFWGFWKLAREIVGPDGELIYPERCNRLDYESEIAIVLGKRGVDLKPGQLEDYVWGVTMLGDWSIRAPQERAGGPFNFAFAKNFDASCSLGPCIAVGEADPTNVDLETWSTASAANASTRARWCSPSVSISNTCPAILRFIRETSSAAGQRPAPQRIRANYCRTAAPRRSGF
jgi:2-keto-4-pentenoate hydratase/2-oxohepta-3-ene-1,7-dioic acid hydratase in catechol pathway